jgi:hypothetical protein
MTTTKAIKAAAKKTSKAGSRLTKIPRVIGIEVKKIYDTGMTRTFKLVETDDQQIDSTEQQCRMYWTRSQDYHPSDTLVYTLQVLLMNRPKDA